MPRGTRRNEDAQAIDEVSANIAPLEELVAVCPKCKAFETLWFSGDRLISTKKFHQDGKHIYHDCGSDEPCRLLVRFIK